MTRRQGVENCSPTNVLNLNVHKLNCGGMTRRQGVEYSVDTQTGCRVLCRTTNVFKTRLSLVCYYNVKLCCKMVPEPVDTTMKYNIKTMC